MNPDFNIISGELLYGFLKLLLNPFYPLSFLFILFIYWRQMKLERTFFSVRFRSPWKETFKAILWGWAAGISVSLMMLLWGMSITFESMITIWAATILFGLFRTRWLCLAYAAGVIGLLQAAWLFVPEQLGWAWRDVPVLEQVGEALLVISFPSLIAVVGLLHIAEAALIRYQGGKSTKPMLMRSKRGKVIGGYRIEGFWPVPLFLLVPTGTMEGSFWWPDFWNQPIQGLPWAPILQADWTAGWQLMAFPVIIGFSEWTRTFWPGEKAKHAANRIFIYGIVIVGLALFIYWWEIWTALASLLVIVLHEVIRYVGKQEERRHPPKYVQDRRGMKILAVLPGSPAELAGIEGGEILVRVNDLKVTDRETLHQALRTNPAYCKLEVLNRSGEIKFVNRAMFSGEHHQMGMIMVPDEQAVVYLESLKRI